MLSLVLILFVLHSHDKGERIMDDSWSLVKELNDKLQCGMMVAAKALKEREYNVIFAEEYILRRDLAVVCSFECRFPKWSAYLKQKGDKNEAK
jgi:hypothetical protein